MPRLRQLQQTIRLPFVAALALIAGCATTGPDPHGDFASCEDARRAVAASAPAFRGVNVTSDCGPNAYTPVSEYVKLTTGEWCLAGYSCARQESNGASG
ncbi:MAG: hypothetical protein K0U93_23675 [Gammaproteobacteria bacterium]|nr:hypothetical protein [Gammaproteobacteria bacterium]